MPFSFDNKGATSSLPLFYNYLLFAEVSLKKPYSDGLNAVLCQFAETGHHYGSFSL